MRIASWLFTLLLGVVLFYASSQLPIPGALSPSLASPLSNRYAQRAQEETGIRSPVGAVMGDYRGFDLLTTGSLFFTSALTLFLFFPGASRLSAWFPALLGLVGFTTAMGLGFGSLFHGSNFLDYEVLASWVESTRARPEGAVILTGGVLLGLGGYFLLALRWLKAPTEGSGER